jgi:phosphonatase-like hydrolase
MGTEKRAAIRALSEIVSGSSPDDAAVDRMFDRFREQLTRAYRERPPAPIDGVLEAFDALRERGVLIALTTGFSQDIATALLDSLGWTVGRGTGTVDALVCGDEVAAGRPAPYLIFRAMERTGVDSVDQVVVAGDTVADLRAGTNAGVKAVVGVASGALSFAQLAPHRHTHLLSGVGDLPELLDTL